MSKSVKFRVQKQTRKILTHMEHMTQALLPLSFTAAQFHIRDTYGAA